MMTDCAWKNGSTQLDGTKAPPERCRAQGCDGRARNAFWRSCYLPVEEPLTPNTSTIRASPSHPLTPLHPRELFPSVRKYPCSVSQASASERASKNTGSAGGGGLDG